MSFGKELFDKWIAEKGAYRRLFPEPIRYYIDEEEVEREEFFLTVKSVHVTTTHTFPPEELSIIAFAAGKDDLDPAHVTQKEIGAFMLAAISDRIDLARAAWLEHGGEKYAQT